MEPLQVGDLCITRNTVVSELNNGLLVVIVAINPWCNDGKTPYRIRRVDGQPMPSLLSSTGTPLFFKGKECWAAGYKLRRIDPDTRSDVRIREAELPA
jgi:hypothetical protein